MTYSTRRSYRPGETVPVSGQYALINPLGHNTGREVTCVKGEVFPPAPVAGCTYVLADRTKHRY